MSFTYFSLPFIVLAGVGVYSSPVHAEVQAPLVQEQTENGSLNRKLQAAVARLHGTTGIAVHIDGGDEPVFSLNGSGRFPMLSVFKFPLALAVLKEVDRNRLSIDQKIQVDRKMMDPDTWSPMREQYPQGGVFSLGQLIRYAVASSDNNACEILFDTIGGPSKVQEFLDEYYGKGCGIRIVCSEKAFQDRAMMYANDATPLAMNRLLRDLHAVVFVPGTKNPLVSPDSAHFLWDVMSHTTLAATCLRGELPKEVVLANKTGYSGERNGLTIARNDVGVIVMPNGRYAVVSVFIRDCRDPLPVMEKAISTVGRLVAEELK